MRFVLHGFWEKIVAVWWWEPPAAGRRLEFASRIEARAFLARLGARPDDILRLRRMMADRLAVLPCRMDDGEVLDRLAHCVAARQLRLVAQPRGHLGSLGGEAAEAPAPAVAWDARPPAPLEEAPRPKEEATFLADVDAAAMAAALKEAAELGVPFCEECFKKAQVAQQATLSEDADAAATAAAMKEAAEHGIPFCEECMKKKQRNARAAQGASA